MFKSLKDRRVVIELKSGLRMSGTLLTVDQYHNVKLDDVQAEDPVHYPQFASVEHLFIRGSSIATISLPPDYVDLPLLQDSCRLALPSFSSQ